jgi:hypothetical protein
MVPEKRLLSTLTNPFFGRQRERLDQLERAVGERGYIMKEVLALLAAREHDADGLRPREPLLQSTMKLGKPSS